MTKITTIKNHAAEHMLALLEGTRNGTERLQTALNRALNKATDRLNDCINARIDDLSEDLIVQSSAEAAKPFDQANKVAAQIDKLNEQRAALLADDELAKAREKSTALLVKRRELLNRKRYF